METESTKGIPSSRSRPRCPMNRTLGCSLGGYSKWSTSPWLLVVYAFFALVLNVGCFRAIYIFIPNFIVEFESSATLMGWIFSMDHFMVGIMTPFAAYFSTKFGTRPVIMVAGLLSAVGVMILSLAYHIALVVMAIGVLTSLTNGLIYSASVLLARRNFRLHYALAHGVVISGYSCRFFIFPTILKALSVTYSWRGTCLITSGIMLNTVVMGALMKPSGRRSISLGKETQDAAARGNDNESGNNIKLECGVSLNRHDAPACIDSTLNTIGKNLPKPVELSTFETGNPVHHVYSQPKDIPYCTKNSYVRFSKNENDSKAMIKDEQSLDIQSHNYPNFDDRAISKYSCSSGKVSVSGVGSNRWFGWLDNLCERNYSSFAIYTLSMFSTTMGYCIFISHASNSFKEFGISLEDISVSFSIFAAGNLIGRLTNGFIVAKGVPPGYLIIMAEILAGLSILATYLCKIYPLRVTAVALYGFATGVYISLFIVFHREIVDPKVDVKTLSIFMIIEGLAGPAGGALGGILRDSTGTYRMTYLTATGLPLFAAVLMIIVISLERHKNGSSERVDDVNDVSSQSNKDFEE